MAGTVKHTSSMGLEGGPLGAQKAVLGANDLTVIQAAGPLARNATSRVRGLADPAGENLAESSCFSSSVIQPVSVGPKRRGALMGSVSDSLVRHATAPF